jgi:hypothetical protein
MLFPHAPAPPTQNVLAYFERRWMDEQDAGDEHGHLAPLSITDAGNLDTSTAVAHNAMSRVGSSSSITHNKHGGINAAAPKAPHHHGCGGCYEHGVNLCEADAELRETVAGTIADFECSVCISSSRYALAVIAHVCVHVACLPAPPGADAHRRRISDAFIASMLTRAASTGSAASAVGDEGAM